MGNNKTIENLSLFQNETVFFFFFAKVNSCPFINVCIEIVYNNMYDIEFYTYVYAVLFSCFK